MSQVGRPWPRAGLLLRRRRRRWLVATAWLPVHSTAILIYVDRIAVPHGRRAAHGAPLPTGLSPLALESTPRLLDYLVQTPRVKANAVFTAVASQRPA